MVVCSKVTGLLREGEPTAPHNLEVLLAIQTLQLRLKTLSLLNSESLVLIEGYDIGMASYSCYEINMRITIMMVGSCWTTELEVAEHNP